MKLRLPLALALASAAALMCGACGGSSSTSTPTAPSQPTTSKTTGFSGTIAGSGGQSGAFSITISTVIGTSAVASTTSSGLVIKPLTVSQVSGTLTIGGGASVALTGTYDSTNNGVSVSGGGFTLTGTISGSVLAGSVAGPSNASGVFSSLNAGQGAVAPYCGTYAGNPDVGIFAVQVSAGGALSGETQPTNGTGTPTTFTGQTSGSGFTFTTNQGGSGTGTIQNGIVSGTVVGGGGGTFIGGACGALPLTVTAVTVNGAVSLGSSAQFSATATLSNGNSINVTTQATWLSSDTTVVTVSPNNGYVTDVGLGSVVVSAAYGGATGLDTLTFNPPQGLPQLQIIPGYPNAPTLSMGQSLQLTATAGWSNVTLNVTNLASWSAPGQPWVSVSSRGLLSVIAVPPGSACRTDGLCPTNVTVAYDGSSNTTTFFVKAQ